MEHIRDPNHSSHLSNSLRRLSIFKDRTIIALVLIISVSVFIRLYYFDYEIPLSVDSLGYFFYAADTHFLGHLPSNYAPANNGWPAFVSLFFGLIHSDEVNFYMQAQKIISIALSAVSIIPVFFLCNRFFERKYSLFGAALFGFEPRIVQNSILGITEPLYILLGAISIWMFLDERRKFVYVAFGISALATLVRSEGIFLFVAFSIMYFIRFRREKFVIPKFVIALAIFLILVIPMALYRFDVEGTDSILLRAASSVSNYGKNTATPGETPSGPTVLKGIENFPKYLGWDLIPVFILLVPPGIVFLFRKIDDKKLTIICTLVTMSIPAFYAYSIPLPETRYFYFLYPLFCIISIYPIKKFSSKFKNQNLVLVIVLGIVIASSIIFLENKIDNKHEKEAFFIAKDVTSLVDVVNSYPPESRYLEVANLPTKWNDIEELSKNKRTDNLSLLSTIPQKTLLVSEDSYGSVLQLINSSKKVQISYIITDDNSKRPEYLKDVFYNENSYPYLQKIYDSSSKGFSYHVKVFRIDYDKLAEFNQIN